MTVPMSQHSSQHAERDDRERVAERRHHRRHAADRHPVGARGPEHQQHAREAHSEVIVFVDADGSHDPNDVPRVAAKVLSGEFDLVIGSRRRGGRSSGAPRRES